MKYKNALRFKDILEVFESKVTRICIDFQQDGIEICEMDPRSSIVIDYKCPRQALEHYACEKTASFGAEISELKECLQVVGKGDILNLAVDNFGWFHIKIEGENTTQCKAPPTTELSRRPVLPTFNPKATAKTEVKWLAEVLTTQPDTEIVTVRIDEDGFNLRCDVGVGTFKTKVKTISLSATEAQEGRYLLGDLRLVVPKLKPLSNVVTLSFTEGLPLKLSLNIGRGEMYVYFAPCVLRGDLNGS